ncbi:forespore capture DNA-binding protein RefZ [Bacillus marinisedimentorum]|uniref:forespore capture DNA-binding protein RefZ n=1 Tax=Bacillus marinisedimentorum TaxID=1821260 RepID=UPI0007E0C5FC|nr:forespore capture DNA-binding protein RefZ [Bacillus marinisedimentorum]
MKVTHATKDRVMEAAALLFNRKGFDGTSVREIAARANVNVALISYYFGGKKGLMEQLLTGFLEGYISALEGIYDDHTGKSRRECLLNMADAVISFQQKNANLARFVQREITLDTMLNRELMTTYLSKEKYLLQSVLTEGISRKEFRKVPVPYTIMQLKGMFAMPYLHPQYLAEVLHVYPNEQYFYKIYTGEIRRWIEQSLCHHQSQLKVIPAPAPGWQTEANIRLQG